MCLPFPITPMKSETNDPTFPLGALVSLESLARDPYPILAELRATEPISWVPNPGMWFVTRYDDCIAILKDTETFTTHSPNSTILGTFGPQMLSLDGPGHRRHRGPCNAVFWPKTVRETLAARIRDRVARLIDAFASHGEVELREEFASRLAVEVVALAIGIPPEDAGMIRGWYERFADALANFSGDADVRQRGLDTAELFRDYLRPHLRRVTAAPDQSLLGVLANATADRLADEEIFSNAMIVLFGGIETTESMMLNAMWAFLTHRTPYEAIAWNPELLRNAIEESLRWDPAVQTCTRHATCDAIVRGVTIRHGETVQCMLGGANRDPEQFPEPDTFDIHRANAADHLTFGHGRHLCIGKHLALLEAGIGLGELVRRLPGLELNQEQSTPPHGHEFRKPTRLHLMWSH